MSANDNDLTAKTQWAKRLKNFFTGKNISHIAEEIGLSRHQITNQCNGKCPPSAKVLQYVAEHGGDAHYILTGEKRARETPTADGFLQEVLQTWPKLSKADKADIAKMAVERADARKMPVNDEKTA